MPLFPRRLLSFFVAAAMAAVAVGADAADESGAGGVPVKAVADGRLPVATPAGTGELPLYL